MSGQSAGSLCQDRQQDHCVRITVSGQSAGPLSGQSAGSRCRITVSGQSAGSLCQDSQQDHCQDHCVRTVSRITVSGSLCQDRQQDHCVRITVSGQSAGSLCQEGQQDHCVRTVSRITVSGQSAGSLCQEVHQDHGAGSLCQHSQQNPMLTEKQSPTRCTSPCSCDDCHRPAQPARHQETPTVRSMDCARRVP